MQHFLQSKLKRERLLPFSFDLLQFGLYNRLFIFAFDLPYSLPRRFAHSQ